MVNDIATTCHGMFPSVLSSHLLSVFQFLRRDANNSATQYTCIAPTKPTSIAGQLSATINLGAASNIATIVAQTGL